MGKTKIKTIDDAVEEKKLAKKIGRSDSAKATSDKEDSLVAKLNAELGITENQEKAPKSSKPETTETVIASADRDSADLQSEAILKIKESDQAKQNDKKQKPGKAKPRSKKYQEAVKNLDRSQTYPLDQAIDIVKKVSYAKFNDKSTGSLEAHINTAQTGVRGLVSLPFASGKKLSIVAFGKGAAESGADIFGTDSTINEIAEGKVNFDLILTTPEWMPKLAKVARILGPKGIMPNPKNGTITDDLKKAVESFQAGKTEFKTEGKAPVIHIALGKLNQPNEELIANVKILLTSIGKTKIKKVSLAPTMGPSVKLDLTSI